jgi:undecaprenyl diphosphate synthase
MAGEPNAPDAGEPNASDAQAPSAPAPAEPHAPAPPEPRSVARYVAIITDGNGRWARARGVPVNKGHEAGADTLKARLRDAVELGIKELTVFSFSTENWSRPAAEVTGLMEMFARRIAGETPELHAEGVRMRFIGRQEGLPLDLVEQMQWAQALTEQNSRITLCVAFNYGGRAEIVDAARRAFAERALQGAGEQAAQGASGRGGSELTEKEFRACLYAPELHDPDIIIRTSGERRLSNYLLWQSAYSELIFRDELWPDFTRQALEESLAEFAERRRRFGGR